MKKINRRDFIKILGAATAAVALGQLADGVFAPEPKSSYGSWDSTSVEGGVLTSEMIEAAAIKAMENFGMPDQMWVYMTDEEWDMFVKQYPQMATA